MSMDINEIRFMLKKYGQEHLLNGYEKLDENKKQILLEQISTIDFELIKSLYNKTKEEIKNKKDEITPIDYLDKFKLNEEYKVYENIGKKAIKEGKLAAVTMAGGQGTRLGYKGPKGTYEIEFEKTGEKKSLFQIMCEDIKRANKKYNVTIPW